ncbi:unnamed protein product, partial [Rotaria sordida]
SSTNIKLRLYYFNCRGRIQAVRYMLEDIAYIHKNVDYKEDFELLEKRDEIWSQHKTNETISDPFHNLPVLHWNDTDTFAQTLTIGQLLARKFNLYGKLTSSIVDQDLLHGYIDGVVSCAYTDVILNSFLCIGSMVDFSDENNLMYRLTKNISNVLKLLNNLLKKSSTSFYYDQLEPTIADYFVFEAFTIARDYHHKLIPNEEDCQELMKLEQIMKERPGLANYFNKDLLFKRFTASLTEILCDLSCYDCSEVVLDYKLTAETVPTEFKNCTIVTEQSNCYMQVKWERNSTTTLIVYGFQYWKADVLGHDLQATVSFSYFDSQPSWSNIIIYRCLTDQCNSPARLKSLLESFKFVNKLEQLQYLLEKDEAFDGKQCLFFSNTTQYQMFSLKKSDPPTCKQCMTIVNMTPKKKVIEASCYSLQTSLNTVNQRVEFDINDRTRSPNWYIACQRANCNTLDVGDLIYQNSLIDFNLEKFIDKTSAGLSIRFSSSFFIVFQNAFNKIQAFLMVPGQKWN